MMQQKEDPICHYCVVRTDIAVGLAGASLVHAAGESSPGDLHPGTYAVVLGAHDEQALTSIAELLERHQVPVTRIVESAGKYHDQLMAIGVKPGLKSERGRYLSTLKLLKMDSFREYDDAEKKWEIFRQKIVANIQNQHKHELQAERSLTWTQRISRWWNRKAQVA